MADKTKSAKTYLKNRHENGLDLLRKAAIMIDQVEI
jgi:hypothetical protein